LQLTTVNLLAVSAGTSWQNILNNSLNVASEILASQMYRFLIDAQHITRLNSV